MSTFIIFLFCEKHRPPDTRWAMSLLAEVTLVEAGAATRASTKVGKLCD
jgi:hypothetical protein